MVWPAAEATSAIEVARSRLIFTAPSEPMSALCPWAMAHTAALSLALLICRPVLIRFWTWVRSSVVLFRFCSAVRAAALVWTLNGIGHLLVAATLRRVG